MQFESSKKESQLEKEFISLHSQCQAYREENTKLSDLLAQRTVLYSAQERRFYNDQRMWGGIRSKQEEEIIQLRTKVQQFESQYASVSKFLFIVLYLTTINDIGR